jgi:hypothetical protein
MSVPDVSRRLAAGTLVKVTMEVQLPVAATEDQVDEWLRYEMHATGSMTADNPLGQYEPEPFGPKDFSWVETGRVGRREEFGHEKTETGTRYRVRYIKEPA